MPKAQTSPVHPGVGYPSIRYAKHIFSRNRDVEAQPDLLIPGQNYLPGLDKHTAEAHVPRAPAYQPQSWIADHNMQSQRLTLV